MMTNQKNFKTALKSANFVTVRQRNIDKKKERKR